jgi:cellulose synthase/poly-beta-1,6-N-acetylglucosamine synthase-like glycosyltransferase
MLTICIIASVILYAVELLLLIIGLWRADRSEPVGEYEPSVSIIVAARNEEESIGDCLASILDIDYPVEKFEIIAVNDGSTDKTVEIMNSFAGKHPHCKIIHTKPSKGNLRGKTNALSQGISASTGEIIMFTDADCRVPPMWVRETVRRFDDQTGIVGGYTLLRGTKPFHGIQALDWLFLFSLASSTIGWGIPLTVIGNNLSIRRKSYDTTGGFEKIPFSVTEDYALVQAIIRSSEYRVKFPINEKTLIRSKPCSTWRDLYRQKERWGVGGLDMVFIGFIIMAISYLAKILLLIGIFTMPVMLTICLFLIMFLAEFAFILKPIVRFKTYYLLKYIPLFFIYLLSYVLVLPFMVAFSRHIVWKARTISKK